MFGRSIAACCLASLLALSARADEAAWKAGVARVDITPELPIWLAGYGARNRPADGVLDALSAKSLALEDAQGNRAVLVTVDLAGISRELTAEVCRRIETRHGVPRSAVAICTSHTHSGPSLRGFLQPLFAFDADQQRRIDAYTDKLLDDLADVAGTAVASLAPARLSHAQGKATFAVNRRNNVEKEVPQLRSAQALVGPVDHDLPVLLVHGAEGSLRAIVAGYACHATVMDGYRVSGDWPGAAQNEIERRHPEAVALFWAGCGADQNPLPRRTTELLNQYGQEFADEVDAVLRGPFAPLRAELQTRYREIPLPFGPLPARADLEAQFAKQTAATREGRWAKHLLDIWDREGALPSDYPYPVQAWRLGDVTWLFLGGEVVVDYSLRLKAELAATAWIASYANDVMGYIPSRRVLAEGGYEGGLARFPFGLPAPWDPRVEELIVAAVRDLAAR